MAKVSISKIDDVIKNNKRTHEIEWNGLTVEVTQYITMQNVSEFVNDVVASAFDSTGAYVPEMEDVKLRIDTLKYYTNITIPNNEAHAYEIVCATNILDAVLPYIDKSQYDQITSSIHKKIQHIIAMNESEVMQRIDETSVALQNLVESIKEMYSGVTKEDISALVSAMGSNGFDEKKIVQAYLDQKK